MASAACCVLSLLLVLVATSLSDDNPGTTEHIKDIFTGRCYDYKQVKYKALLPQVSDDCDDLYALFFKSFSFMPPCAVSMSLYQPFMSAASQALPPGKAMFWSGVKTLVHEYARNGQRYVTLEDTLIGYVVDGLVWCGQGITPGMNFSRCPSWNDCPLEASESFWAAASKTFASSASGEVTVMLDGSRSDRPAYRQDSFFGKYELPFLKKGVVTGVDVLLTHPLETPAVETCQNGSLVKMKQDVTSQGFSFTCEDDPEAILHLLCADNPDDRECQLAARNIVGPIKDQAKSDPDQAVPRVFNSKPDRVASTTQYMGR